MTPASAAATVDVYIGTSQSGPGTGISRALFDATTGDLSPPELILVTPDPAYFVFHPDGRHLYTCNSGTPGGVSALARDPATGALSLLNHVVSTGRGPSHVSLDHTGRSVLAANSGGGYVEVIAITPDGRLGARTAFNQLEGRSIHPERQTKPYAHCVRVDPANRFALTADLGTDRVVVYRFEADIGTLEPHAPPHASVTPGSGPRHLAWHPNGRWLYVSEELANTVTAMAWDGANGVLTEQQTIGTLPAGFTKKNTAAEIAVHPEGRFLYVSNRGHDSIAIFALDPSNGLLTALGHTSSRGRTPRYFALDPSGHWMIVTNHDSDNLTILRVDATTGGLTPHGDTVRWPRPFGVAFVAKP